MVTKRKIITNKEEAQCYRDAKDKLEDKDRVTIERNLLALEDGLFVRKNYPINQDARMEILAKLGQWLNREMPTK